MPLASSSSVQVRYIQETVFGTTPVAGNPRNLRVTGETMDFTVSKEQSKEINSTRTITSVVPVTAAASGNVTGEIAYQEWDTLMAATLQSAYTVFGTNGVGAAFSSTAGGLAATSITASAATTGINIWTSLQKGQWFKLTAPGDTNNDGRVLRVSTITAPTTTVITLDVSTPLVLNAGTVAACTISTSRLTHGTTQTSYSIERNASDITQFMTYTGMTPSKMSVGVSTGGLSSISFDFMGKSMNRAATTNLPGAPIASYNFDIHSGVSSVSSAANTACVLWEGGVPIVGTYVKSISLDFDNSLRSQEAICTLGAVAIGSGTIQISGSLSVYFADGALFDKFKANTNSSIIFSSLDSSNNGYVFTIPVANISSWKTNASSKDQDMMVDIQFIGLRDEANAVAGLKKAMFIDRVGVATT